MTSLTRRTFITGLALAVLGITGCNYRPSGSSDWTVKVGDPIPAFSLRDVDGNVISSESLNGTPYSVAVFATWCPPCKMELQALEQQAWQPLKDRGIKVLGINFGDEDADMIRKFGQDNGLTFPLLVDESGTFRDSVGVSAIPQSIVVGADGRIVELHVGYTDDAVASMKEVLEASLR